MMKTVEILLMGATVDDTRTWGEVKAMEEPGTPTVAHIEARRSFNDMFQAKPGRHVYQFRVDRSSKIVLHCRVDGALVGSATEFDCTTITAGRRYVFEVPS